EPKRDPFFAIIGRGGAQLFVKSDKGTSPLPNPKQHPSMRWDAFVYVPDPDALGCGVCRSGRYVQCAFKGHPRWGARIRDLRPRRVCDLLWPSAMNRPGEQGISCIPTTIYVQVYLRGIGLLGAKTRPASAPRIQSAARRAGQELSAGGQLFPCTGFVARR